jgi:hypothetical protein
MRAGISQLPRKPERQEARMGSKKYQITEVMKAQ